MVEQSVIFMTDALIKISCLDDNMHYEIFNAHDAREGGLTLNGRHPGHLLPLVLFGSIFFLKGLSASDKYFIGGAFLATALLFAAMTMAERPAALMPVIFATFLW